ncbi:hypothetical protein GGS26DRAFT_467059 [Hypomontagnella submonticulosa]|nr:hypothetical protein GGS26DRAFT_467059 [Hypomontagnella submonticulosa]
MCHGKQTKTSCGPTFNADMLRREHGDRHAELMRHFGASQNPDKQAEIRRLISRADKLDRKVRHGMGEARHLCSSAMGIRDIGSPPRRQVLKGKCVWVESARSGTEELPEVQPLDLGPPRLRNTKTDYRDPFAGAAEQEQPPISGPPRLRTNKKYTGPRENVVSLDVEQKEWVSRPEPSLRRMRSVYGLSNSGVSNNRESDATVKPTSPGAAGDGSSNDEIEEDMWLKLADKNN